MGICNSSGKTKISDIDLKKMLVEAMNNECCIKCTKLFQLVTKVNNHTLIYETNNYPSIYAYFLLYSLQNRKINFAYFILFNFTVDMNIINYTYLPNTSITLIEYCVTKKYYRLLKLLLNKIPKGLDLCSLNWNKVNAECAKVLMLNSFGNWEKNTSQTYNLLQTNTTLIDDIIDIVVGYLTINLSIWKSTYEKSKKAKQIISTLDEKIEIALYFFSHDHISIDNITNYHQIALI